MQVRQIAVLGLSALLAGCAQRGTPIAPAPETTLLDNPTAALPGKISQTGLYHDPLAETPDPRLIPYTVRYALYSDDNDKSRYLFLPPGGKIDNRDPQQWFFPEGTLFFKTFYLTTMGNHSLTRRKIETRVLQRRRDGWQVGVYQWNSAGDEAFLTDGNDIRFRFRLPLGDYVYTIPGRLSCLACHQPQKDFVIGFEAIRLSGVVTADGEDQLRALAARNIFLQPAATAPVEIPGPPLEAAAIGYLHGNCANCHNPHSPVFFTTGLDLRYTHLKQSTINVRPQKYASDDTALVRIKPGRPGQSLLFQLLARTLPDSTQFMPPIGTSRVDSAGVALIRRWILSL
ncbi:MAG: hypothetical protein ONB48_07615 [candidate division KSB1 bacterium]|nr:hypothetical protein [candidate division KSB1 bacterium]MDZ7274689.1 hypothetical protein [candidate division KSB1 bacterium]MDZ7285514.1 hypothetical protein [candidate division KSB1 bacterium]MDZ7298546.1 hypothetical protein [candidate division KSB1 bacterium]MDZ7306602.1 hypothetical protein [candidate division KSB1 bacterium]